MPGPRDPYLTPYAIAFERFFAGEKYETCAFVTGTQMSKTDGVLDVMGWRLATKPRPQLYVGPSRDFVTEQFEPRLMKLFDEAEKLAPLVGRGKRNKKFRKIVAGVSVRLAWAGSETSLASDQAGDIYIDEYDKMFVGRKGTGDAFGLAKARGDTYPDRKIAVTSTPKRGRVGTYKCETSGLLFWQEAAAEDLDSPIWGKWQSGTRHHWAWRCPHCSEWFIPRLANLKPPKDNATPFEARQGAYVVCESGCVILEEHKAEMNAGGQYVAPGQWFNAAGELEGEAVETSILSLWVSGLASPFVTWGERLEEIMNARISADPETIQAAVNKVAEVYAPIPATAPKLEAVLKLRCPYVMRDRGQDVEGETPREAMRLVCGADVGLWDIHYSVRGYGSRGSSWLVDGGKLRGHTGGHDIWDDLADVLLDTYGGLRVELAFIDSGFRPDKLSAGDVHRVYDFVRKYSWLCKATKGHATRSSPLSVVKHEVKPNGKASPFSVDLVHLDTDFFKSLVHTRMATEPGRPGSLGLPSNIPLEYVRHLTSEARELVNGRPVWTPLSKANHWLDCEAMAAAAGYLLNVHRMPEGLVREWDEEAPPLLSEREAVPVELARRAETPGVPSPPAATPPKAVPPRAAKPQAAVAAKTLRESVAAKFAARAGRFSQR